jgi:hypothetical protein
MSWRSHPESLMLGQYVYVRDRVSRKTWVEPNVRPLSIKILGSLTPQQQKCYAFMFVFPGRAENRAIFVA